MNAKDASGKTPLDYAIEWENTEVIKFLQESGAKSGSTEEIEKINKPGN